MADRKISDLTALTAPASGDYLPIVDISEAAAANKNKRITIEELFRGIPLGTAAAPSIAIEGDENTGIYSPGADQLAISTGGSGRLFVDASGNVSIGGGIQGTGPFSAAGVRDAYAAGIYTGQITAVDTSAYNAGPVAGLSFAYKYDAGDNYTIGATIHGIKENATNGNYASALRFTTRVNGSDVAERLRITSNGTVNIVGAGTAGSTQAISFNGSAPVNSLVVDSSGRCGIGTSAPSAMLDVRGNGTFTGNATARQTVDFTNTGGQLYVGVESSSGGAVFTSSSAYAGVIGTNNSTSLQLATNGAIRATLDTSGRVGIGTTGPTATVHANSGSASDVYFRSSNSLATTSLGTAADGSTYVYNSSAYPISFFTNATERARIDSSGTFRVKGAGTAGVNDAFAVNGSAPANSAQIDSSGRLLVGTSTASSAAGQGTPQIQSAGDYQQSSILLRNTSNDNTNCALVLQKIRGSSIVQSGDYLGQVAFDGYDGAADRQGATIAAIVDGAPGSGDLPTRLVFSTTADGASSTTERMRITNDGQTYFGITGNTGLGTTNRGFLIRNEIAGKTYVQLASTGTTTDTVFYFYNGNGLVGSISMNGSATAYNTSSDYRLKENVAPVPDGIARLQQLKPSRFNFIADPATTVDGFIAHEVQAVVPEAITGEKDAVDDDGNPIYQGIDQSKLVPLLTAALQEAVAKIESLEARLTAAGI